MLSANRYEQLKVAMIRIISPLLTSAFFNSVLKNYLEIFFLFSDKRNN